MIKIQWQCLRHLRQGECRIQGNINKEVRTVHRNVECLYAKQVCTFDKSHVSRIKIESLKGARFVVCRCQTIV